MQNETSAVPGTGIGDLHAPVPVAGYRPLSQAEVDLINEAKTLGRQVGAFIDKLNSFEGLRQQPGYKDSPEFYPHIDGRWLSIAKTDLQKGFMFLARAIARPEGF